MRARACIAEAPGAELQVSSVAAIPHWPSTASATSTVCEVAHKSRSTFGPAGTVTAATTFWEPAALETEQDVENVRLAPRVESG